MTSKQRFLTALNGGKPDTVPCYDFLFSLELFDHVVGNIGSNYKYNAVDALKCADALGLDGVWIPFGGLVDGNSKVISDTEYIDEWGTTFRKEKASWPIDGPIKYPIETQNDLDNYCPPQPNSPSRLEEIKTASKINSNKLALVGGLNGPLTTATFLMGLENICINFYEDPELLKNIFAMSNKFWIEAGIKMVENGADVIIFGEDLGYDKGLFASPQLLRTYLFPYINQLVRTFTDKGIPVIMHSDGKLHEVLDDLVGFGINGYHPSERKSGMNLSWMKEKYGKKFCLFGNVDSSTTLPYGTAEDVEHETLQCLNDAKVGGGYILGSDHSLHDGIPVENMFRMFETVKRYGRYE